MGGGFGGQQSPMLQKPMEPQMPQQNPGGFGGGGMGAFQDFMRQQQQQASQQPAYGGFDNGMGINIAQPPQQSGGLLGSLRPQQPQQNPGGFGNQQQSQLQQALQSFTGQQQMGQQAPQMPMIGPGGGNRDFYDRQVSPEQRARNEAAMADGSYAAYYQQATGQPLPQQQQMPQQQMPPQNLIAMLQGMGNRLGSTGQPLGEEGFGPAGSRPVSGLNRGVALPTPTPQQQQRQQQNQMPPPVNMDQLIKSGLADFKPQMPPQMPMRAPQQVRPEPPRMQAMRGIQQLANRQRGYNR
jgi:hypothetical protein